jgi:ferredoxin--NADP+ reductase
VLVHGCRQIAELAYGEKITHALPKDEYLGELIREKLIYYPTVTREPFQNRGRVTDLIASGQLFKDIDMPVFDPANDRAMLCGSPQMLADMKKMLEDSGFVEGSSGKPATYGIEKAFVEK